MYLYMPFKCNMSELIPVCSSDLVGRIAAESGADVEALRRILEIINNEEREAKQLRAREQRRSHQEEVPRYQTVLVNRQPDPNGTCQLHLRETRVAQQLVRYYSDHDESSAEVSGSASDCSTASDDSFDSQQVAADYDAVAEGIEDSPERFLNSQSDSEWCASSSDVTSSQSSLSSHNSIEADDAAWQLEQDQETALVVSVREEVTTVRKARFAELVNDMRQECHDIMQEKEEMFVRASGPLPLPPMQQSKAQIEKKQKKRKKAGTDTSKPRKKPVKHNVSVADLINAGLLQAGTGVILYSVKKADIQVDLLETGNLSVKDREFTSPSTLAQFLSDRPSDGWRELKYQGRTLDYYRQGLSLSRK